jgi:hypothetical protein
MPVPVPHVAKPPAHIVTKSDHPGDLDQARIPVLHHLFPNLPLHVKGPAASQGDWTGSIPYSRPLNKPHRIWEDDVRKEDSENVRFDAYYESGAAPVDLSARPITLPPLSRALNSVYVPPITPMGYVSDEEDDMAHDGCTPAHGMGGESSWHSPIDVDMGVQSVINHPDRLGTYAGPDSSCCEDYGGMCRSQGLSPGYDDPSPALDAHLGPDSSPIGPLTPFGDFVDRAVATADAPVVLNDGYWADTRQLSYPCQHGYFEMQCGCQPQVAYACEPTRAQPPPTLIITPTADTAYKKLADPLAEWVATYVWKVCTTGMDVRPEFTAPYVHYVVNELPRC